MHPQRLHYLSCKLTVLSFGGDRQKRFATDLFNTYLSEAVQALGAGAFGAELCHIFGLGAARTGRADLGAGPALAEYVTELGQNPLVEKDEIEFLKWRLKLYRFFCTLSQIHNFTKAYYSRLAVHIRCQCALARRNAS